MDLTGWPDYVFEDGYNLMSLKELRMFIAKNKHLPDAPSEAEVIQNGQNLGEMNAILLRKIEEMMLYLFELKAENDSMKEVMNKIQSELNQLKK